ncbi:MAG: hypothetical protein WAQ24_05580 [Candidatus Saccharimonadales bacterium]
MKISGLLVKATFFWMALILWMSFTHPMNMPVYILVIPFIVLGFAVYYACLLAVALYDQGDRTKTKRGKAISITIACLVAICAAMQSIGELTPRDLTVTVLLILVGYFYATRNK